ncbi:helix-turn-helix domain-containing protein [Salmonella enterica subsp. enterica serovar Montevideo]
MRTFKGLSLDPKDAFRNIASMINTGMLITVIDGEERTDLGDAIFHQAKLYAEAASAYLFTCPQKTYTIPTPSPSPTHQLNAQTAAPDARTLGTRIRQLRKERMLTQAEVAAAVNVTAQAVYLWESDSVIMSVDKLLPLADALQCDPMWLLTGNATHQFPATQDHQSRYQHFGPLRSDASDHASHHEMPPSQA